MYGDRKFITAVAASFALFIVLCYAFDRDLCRITLIPNNVNAERERGVILGVLKKYNSILTDIYVTGGVPALLNEFPATKAIRHGLFRDIGFIRARGSVIVYDMADMIPIDIRITSPVSAEAVVFEEWNYLYQSGADRKPLTRIRGIGQGFLYRLVRQESMWFIVAWDPVSVEDPADKGFLY